MRLTLFLKQKNNEWKRIFWHQIKLKLGNKKKIKSNQMPAITFTYHLTKNKIKKEIKKNKVSKNICDIILKLFVSTTLTRVIKRGWNHWNWTVIQPMWLTFCSWTNPVFCQPVEETPRSSNGKLSQSINLITLVQIINQ